MNSTEPRPHEQLVETTDPVARKYADRIISLRRLQIATGTRTYKSQSAILESLSPQMLAAVSLILEQEKVPAHDRTNPRQ